MFLAESRLCQAISIAFAMAGLCLGSNSAHAQTRSGVGLNLSGIAYYSPALPTIDQFKLTDKWLTQCGGEWQPVDIQCAPEGDQNKVIANWDTGEQNKLDLDENGWVKRLPTANSSDKYRYVSALFFQENNRSHVAGNYTILYDGKGKISYGLNFTVVSQEQGKDVVTVSNTRDEGLLISITQTDPTNYLRNIRVIPPGGVCAKKPEVYADSAAKCTDKTGPFVPFTDTVGQKTWHPAFLADLKGFRTLRFMDWGMTNGYVDPATWAPKVQPLIRWADRPQDSHAFWASNKGAPYTAMFDLAASAGADPWINLPPQIDDDFAIQFGQLAKRMLAPGHDLILEYGNEPWNGMFPATGWYVEQGQAKVARKEWDDKHEAWELGMNWHALRATQVCQLVKSQFGTEAKRVKCVMNGQASWTDLARQYLDCSMASQSDLGGKPCSDYMDALAIAPYFGDYLSSINPDVRAARQTWYTQKDGGLSKVFEELLGEDAKGNAIDPPLLGKIEDSVKGGAIELSRKRTESSYALAQSRGLSLFAYEGGQHLVKIPSEWVCVASGTQGSDSCGKYEDANALENDQNWVPLLIAANRDPRMAKAYTRFMQKWIDEKAQTYLFFNHIGTPGQYGAWGLKEQQFSNDWVKWKAIQPYRKGDCWWAGCAP